MDRIFAGSCAAQVMERMCLQLLHRTGLTSCQHQSPIFLIQPQYHIPQMNLNMMLVIIQTLKSPSFMTNLGDPEPAMREGRVEGSGLNLLYIQNTNRIYVYMNIEKFIHLSMYVSMYVYVYIYVRIMCIYIHICMFMYTPIYKDINI